MKIGWVVLITLVIYVTSCNSRVSDERIQLQIDQLRQTISAIEVRLPETKLKAYLDANKVITSAELARALAKVTVENQMTLAAIAVKESNGDPKAVGSHGEKGVFQVRECYWGKVPRDIEGQVMQADNILTQLKQQEASEFHALMAYNGTGPRARRYAEDILKLRGE